MALDGERDAREKAEEANAAKDGFLATLSHELRTPLNAILGWAQVLAHEDAGREQFERGLDAIERNSRLQALLIDDLLDMSRIVSGKIRLDLRTVDLREIVENALVAIAPSASAKSVTVERGEIDPKIPPIQGDPERIQQILWNLLSNAVKFTPPGGVARVSLCRAHHNAEITVSDNGIGIPAALLDRIFDPFLQADASTTRHQGGLGLGLSISQSLAELHCGSIIACSEGEGKGASFTLRLPTATPSPARAEREEPPLDVPPQSVPSDRLGGTRVLIVDDEEDGRELSELVLRRHGAETRMAPDAAQALELIEKERYDVLVCDIAMPGRDGYDLIQDIRRRGCNIPAIALTAFAQAEDEAKALNAGFQMHLAKPVDAEKLVAAVAELASASRNSALA